ncbi:hypothetical protein OIU79_006643 [Salix purpurea]|uniref:Uncharacterized protein n=1 Tax=Salix purpurea TaxID=77065 RepID=A0A9Q0TW39_SALPP|nr:hypothetical protein OIU79_006643 [Salix purpurea]
MDSNASGFLHSPPALHSAYYQPREDGGIIDLGLSLRTLQPEACHPSGHRMPLTPVFNFCLNFCSSHQVTELLHEVSVSVTCFALRVTFVEKSC